MTAQSPAPRRRETAQQVVLEHVRQLISTGTLKPDDRIRQDQLAEELSTSVVPVREALKILEAEGMVQYVPHRGYSVTRLSLAELTETYLVRRLLEDEVVRLGAPKLTAGDFAALEQAMDVMERAGAAGDLGTMIEANKSFHFRIFAAAQMPLMANYIRMLWQSTDAYRAFYYAEGAARDRVHAEHRRIVDALRDGDIEGAIAELHQHREHAVKALSARLGGQ